VELTVYSREYCHLCHDMVEALEALRPRHGFSLRVVDVDAEPELESRLGERVPVLEGSGREICHHVLDPVALDAFLAQFR
jgi:thioredoxin reductase (NADPH)